MKRRRRVRKNWIFLFCMPFFVYMLLCGASMLKNDKALSAFSKQLYEYPLPADTEIVTTQQVCGNLFGRDRSMDYAAVMLLKTTQSVSQIKKHYFRADFQGISHSADKPSMEIIRISNSQFSPYYIPNIKISLGRLQQDIGEAEYVAVVLTDTGHRSIFDLRSR